MYNLINKKMKISKKYRRLREKEKELVKLFQGIMGNNILDKEIRNSRYSQYLNVKNQIEEIRNLEYKKKKFTKTTL